MKKKILIVFDVDGTLEISNGNIPLVKLMELKKKGRYIFISNQNYFFTKSLKKFLPKRILESIPSVYNKYSISELASNNLARADILKLISEFYPNKKKIYIGDRDVDIEFARQAGYEFIRNTEFEKMEEKI